MAKLVRIFLKPFALLLAVVQNATAAPSVGAVPPTPTPAPVDTKGMSAFLKQLRDDPELRIRFAHDPRAAFREHGIDPAPFRLPDTLDPAWVEDFLRAWMGPTGPRQRPLPAVDRSPPQVAATPPSVVYGPPPTPAPHQSDVPPPPPRPTQPDEMPPVPRPPSPAPVYGPPPGPPRR